MIGARKLDHIRIALAKNVQSNVKSGFEDAALVHRALPEINKGEIKLETSFLGRKIDAPLIIAGMTGGHEKAEVINRNLALAAQELGIPMGLGSQRAAIEDSRMTYTFSVAREVAPRAFLIANLGIAQFCRGYDLAEARKAVDMIKADALAVHLNPLHEAVQSSGDVYFKGCLARLKKLCKLKVPIIAKETGAGVCREDAKLLEKAGVAAIDVGGLGGTSFAAIEHYRSKGETLGKTFWDWGIPTAISTVECSRYTKLPVIATGGIRNGIDVAKAIALGASCCGLALPLLDKARKGYKEVVEELRRIIEELKTAMFLVGAGSIGELKQVDVVITGRTREWLELRGVDCREYANRRMV
jgi:isopentenyl-diphosphate delta-isomerase